GCATRGVCVAATGTGRVDAGAHGPLLARDNASRSFPRQGDAAGPFRALRWMRARSLGVFPELHWFDPDCHAGPPRAAATRYGHAPDPPHDSPADFDGVR